MRTTFTALATIAALVLGAGAFSPPRLASGSGSAPRPDPEPQPPAVDCCPVAQRLKSPAPSGGEPGRGDPGGMAATAGARHERGLASFYGGDEPLNTYTASGEVFDASLLTAAHRTLPFGTLVRVTRVSTGASVVVRVNDRGPAARLSDRVIDLSREAFRRLAPLGRGLITVTVEVADG